MLDIVGDRWTMLVIRDLFMGRTRFKELAASPEGMATNLLSERLVRLVRHGLIDKVPPADGSKHLEYRLTDKGRALMPTLQAMRDWGLEWEAGTEARLAPIKR